MTLNFFIRKAIWLSAFCSLALMVGCSKDLNADVADLGDVTGSVTYNGKPVVHGTVQFAKGGTRVAVANIEKDGTYRTLLTQGEFTVAVVTMIEPRDAAKLVNEGPPELSGAIGGRIPVRQKKDAPKVEEFDKYKRLPTLDAVLAKLATDEKNALEAIEKQYGDAEKSGLKITVTRGPQTHNFDLK